MNNSPNVFRVLFGNGDNSDAMGSLDLASLAKGDLAVVGADQAIIDTEAGATGLADNDVFYIVQGTGNKKKPFLYSHAMTRKSIRKYSVKSVSAEVQKEVDVDFTDAGFTAAAGDTIVVSIVLPLAFKYQLQRQEREDFYIEVGANDTETGDNLVAAIEKSEYIGDLLEVSNTTGVVTLTAKEQPVDTRGIDLNSRFSFDVYITPEDRSTDYNSIITVNANGFDGVGTYKQMKDLEYFAQGELGVHNRVQFPQDNPTEYVEKDCSYNQLIIEHDSSNYKTIDGNNHRRLTTIVAVKDDPATPTNPQGDPATANGFADIISGAITGAAGNVDLT